MNLRNEWNIESSSLSDTYYTKEETIDSVKANFDFRRNYSTEGKSVLIDKIYTEQVLIQQHTNPLNENKIDRKMHVSVDSKLKEGSIVDYENCLWLVLTKIKNVDDAYKSAQIRECNYTLPFQTISSTVIQEPCIVLSQSDALSGEDQGNVITLSDTQRAVIIQYNENTKYLIEQKRLFIDQLCDKPKVYKITKADRIYYMNGTNGLLKLTCDEDQTVGANDNVPLKIADYISTDPSPTPTPTTLGISAIANTKNVIYTTSVDIKVGSTGTSAKPFVAIFKDTNGNVVQSLQSKWSLVLDSALTDKVSLTYNPTYPDRCYVNVINDSLLIGSSFELHLVDVGSLYGECVLKCQVVNLYG